MDITNQLFVTFVQNRSEIRIIVCVVVEAQMVVSGFVRAYSSWKTWLAAVNAQLWPGRAYGLLNAGSRWM